MAASAWEVAQQCCVCGPASGPTAVLVTASGEHGGSQDAGDPSGRSSPRIRASAGPDLGWAGLQQGSPGRRRRLRARLLSPRRSQIISGPSRRSSTDPSANPGPRGTWRSVHRTHRL
ncbi:hypothetical protein NDU88_002598 [Pleurodeles waltl]|uniref:Uncharacterized protein n=1 Tax=Pleurodeles waltl TaxID=8319 RepID=A0AAV7VFE4_PLEWA|nr:hypothetical protein NDU88_002598 [Pleurodeles waltl]